MLLGVNGLYQIQERESTLHEALGEMLDLLSIGEYYRTFVEQQS